MHIRRLPHLGIVSLLAALSILGAAVEVVTNTGLLASDGPPLLVTPSMLQAQAEDTDQSSIRFFLVLLPTIGQFELVS